MPLQMHVLYICIVCLEAFAAITTELQQMPTGIDHTMVEHILTALGPDDASVILLNS